MAKYIAHASGGENSAVRIKGGEAGDQTKKEVCIRTWYDFACNCVLRFTDKFLAALIGNIMIAIASNDNVGYDQGGRNTLLEQAEKVKFDIAKIKTVCECDCSSAVTVAILGAIYMMYGEDEYEKAKRILVVDGNCATTRTLKSRCMALGVTVEVYTSTAYTRGTAKAVFGDIYLKEGTHVAAYIADGEDAETGIYVAGKEYTLKSNMKVRTGAGTNYSQKLRSQLTADGKKHAKAGTYAVLLKGTKVTCKKVITSGTEVWLQIPSGYVCAKQGSKVWIG